MEPLCKLGLSRVRSQRSFDNFQSTSDKNLEKICVKKRQNSALIDIKFTSFGRVFSSEGAKTSPNFSHNTSFNFEQKSNISIVRIEYVWAPVFNSCFDSKRANLEVGL